MNDEHDPRDLEELLDRFDEAAADRDEVTFDEILDHVGRRSFGPLLLVAGLIMSAPIIGDIPGVPTVLGIFVILLAGQLIFHRDHFWLPQWMLKRSVSAEKFRKTTDKWLRPPARWIDKFLRPRLQMFTNGAGTYAIAIVCALMMLIMPATELVPFSANIIGAGLVFLGVALIAKDGVMALIGFAFAAATLLTLGTVLL